MTILDDNKYIAQNTYNQYIQRELLAVETGEIILDVWVAPTSKFGWLIIEPTSSSNREEIFYHKIVGTSIYFYDVNREWAKNHANGSVIILANSAGIYNFKEKDNENIFFSYKTSANDLEIFGWYIVDTDWNQFVLPNTNTSTLSLTNSALNYIYVTTLDAGVSYELASTTVQSDTDFVIKEVTKDAGGIITLAREWRQRWQWLSTNGWVWIQGTQWITWDTWPQGIQWITWDTWPQGIQWITWDTWPQGIQWLPWDTWDTWPQGIQWITWDTWADSTVPGPTWPEWIVWLSAYNALTAYMVDDAVSYNGASYICILASTWNLPTNITY